MNSSFDSWRHILPGSDFMKRALLIIFLAMMLVAANLADIRQAALLNRGRVKLLRGLMGSGYQGTDPSQAEQDFEDILGAAPGHVSATDGLMQIRLAQGNVDAALTMLRRSPLVGSGRERMDWLALANWYLARGDIKHMTVALQSAGELQKPDTGWRLLSAAEYALERGQEDQALSLAHLAASVPPMRDTPQFHLELGQMLMDLGDTKEAVLQYEQRVRFVLDDVTSLRWLGEFYEKLGQNEIAVAYYQRVATLQPDSDWAIHRIALVYVRQGRHEEAEAMLWRAIETVPRHEGALATLGVVYLSQGKLDQAATVLERTLAAGKSPSVKAWAHSLLAEVYLQRDEPDLALEQIEAAIELRLSLNQFDEVLGLYQKVLTTQSLAPWADHFQQQIKLLESGDDQ